MEELGALLETGGVAAVELAATAMAARGEKAPPCPSCGKPLIGPFCAVCGQPRNTHRRTVRGLVHEFVKDVVSFDSRILRTTRALLLRPGELPKAFRDGRTQPYVPAVRLYLFVSLLFFLFLSATGIAFIQFRMEVSSYTLGHDAAGNVHVVRNGKRVPLPGFKADAKNKVVVSDAEAAGGLKAVYAGKTADGHTVESTIMTPAVFFQPTTHMRQNLTPEMKTAIEEINKTGLGESKDKSWISRGLYVTLKKLETDPAALNEPMTTWIPRILFVLLPLFAALLALFYRAQRKDYLFVDHLVFSLTMHSFAFVLLIVAATLAQVMAAGWVAMLAWGALSLYFLLSLKYFYRQSWFKTAFKFVCISFVYATFFLAPALLFALAASVVWA
jgi:hypothetical protein